MTKLPAEQDITRLLKRAESGDAEAMAYLLPAIYDDLRRIAHARLRGERQQTLGTTALVHEGWLAMHKGNPTGFANRQQYFAYAAKAMRHVLVDRARQRAAGKRQVPASDELPSFHSDSVDLLALDQALGQLAEQSTRLAEIVELRVFIGLSTTEIAELNSVAKRTVERDWQKARALLSHALDVT